MHSTQLCFIFSDNGTVILCNHQRVANHCVPFATQILKEVLISKVISMSSQMACQSGGTQVFNFSTKCRKIQKYNVKKVELCKSLTIIVTNIEQIQWSLKYLKKTLRNLFKSITFKTKRPVSQSDMQEKFCNLKTRGR